MSKQYNVVTNLVAKTTDFVNGMKKASDTTNNFTQNFKKRMDDTGKRLRGVGTTMSKYLTVPLTGLGVGLIKVASDAEEMRGKFSVVFDGMEKEMRDFAEESSKAWGRSQLDLEGYLASTQNMLVGMGMVREEGAKLSKDIVGLGVDLASFNNMAESDALRNLESAISGNHSAAKSLGAVLNENTIAVEMERMGLQGKFQDLDEATKMQVRYNAILSQSTDAVGDAERTSGSFANQMRRLTGRIKDVSADFGAMLLPMATKVITKIGNLVTWFGNLDGSTQKIIMIIGGLGAVIPPLLIGLGFLASAIGAIGAPVALIVAAITGFIAILVSAYATNEEFRDRVNNAFQNVREFVSNAIQFIRDFWDEHGQAILDRAQETFNNLQEVVFTVLDAVTSFIQEKLGFILDFWNENSEQIMQAVQNVFSFLQSTVEFVMPFVTSIIELGWNVIKNIFDFALNTILSLVQFFVSIFTGDWSGAFEAIKSIANGALEFVSNLFQSILEFIGEYISKALQFFQDLFSDGLELLAQITSNLLERIRNAIVSPIESARDSISNLLARIGGFFSDSFSSILNRADRFKNGFIRAWNGIRDGVKVPINGIIGFANSVLSGYERMLNGIGNAVNRIPSFKIPNWVPGIGGGSFGLPSIPRMSLPKIPFLAEGGLVTKATMALIGEGDEQEAVLPLSKLFGMMDSFSDTVVNRLFGNVENVLSTLVNELDFSELTTQSQNQTLNLNPTIQFNVTNATQFDQRTAEKYAKYTMDYMINFMKPYGFTNR